MVDHLSTVFLALGPGALVGLLALGLIIIFRSSNVLNLAHPAMATLGAYAYYELSTQQGWTPAAALAGATVFVGLVSVLVYSVVMRPLAAASPLTKLVASVAVLMVVQSSLLLAYGNLFYSAPSLLPQDGVRLPGGVQVAADRPLLILIVLALTAALWLFYRYSRFGVATSAFAESPFVARVFALPSARLAVGNWFLGGALAGLAGALLAPVTGLNLTQLSGLIVPVLAAAVVGSLTSFPLAVLGALGISALQSEATRVTSMPGAAELVPFVVIVLLMVVRGRRIPIRSAVGLRLPTIGSGRVHSAVWLGLTALSIVSIYTWLPTDVYRPVLTNLAYAVVLLSVVVVTGYAGQVSLAQFALAGLGAYVAGSVAAHLGWTFVPAFVTGLAVSTLAGALVALPALRLRGISLAVITLSFSVVVYAAILNRTESITVASPSVLGIDLSMITSPRNYLTLTVGVLAVCLLAVGNLRRSGSGLRMIAMRHNERAAAAMGIDVARLKIVSFALGGAIAGAGGILIAYQTPVMTFSGFDPFESADVLAWTTIGGIGYLLGPLLGSMFVPGSLGTTLGEFIYDDAGVLGLAGGIILILTLVLHPHGVASLGDHLGHLRRHLPNRLSRVARAPSVVDDGSIQVRDGRTLHVDGVRMAFGGVTALADVSFQVRPGQVHGLIGSNGAGKTTLLDVVSGFARPQAGRVRLGDEDLSAMPTWKRARTGLGRSFQNVQLFPDLTVLDNLRVAGVTGGPSVLRDLVSPGKRTVPPAVRAAIVMLGLEDDLDRDVEALTHGKRQLVSIARALATAPDFVLLDEPAAGLDEVERGELRLLLRRLAADLNIAILLVEHDVELVMGVCDWVTVLHQGRVIAQGTTEAVRSSTEVRDAYLGIHEAGSGSALATSGGHTT